MTTVLLSDGWLVDPILNPYGGLNNINAWRKANVVTPVALAVTANVIVTPGPAVFDLTASNNFTCTLQATTGQTLPNPSAGMNVGFEYTIDFIGGNPASTVSFGSWYQHAQQVAAEGMCTTASAKATLSCRVTSSTEILYSWAKRGVA